MYELGSTTILLHDISLSCSVLVPYTSLIAINLLLILLFLAVIFIVVSSTRWKLHPFLSLFIAALGYGICSGMALDTLLTSINQGFGNTLGGIGLVIIIGVIIGVFLERSGAAYRLAQTVLGITGEKRVPLGMSLIGYIVSIPVFADSGFMLLQPLNKALSKKSKISLACTTVALAMGLMASHAMVPPTPGPIAAAGFIGADIGLVIFYGLIVSLLSLIPCLWFARKVASKYTLQSVAIEEQTSFETQIKNAPSTFNSFLPIVVPILLILIKSFNELSKFLETGILVDIINFLGTPVIALLIGLGLALLLPKKLERKMLSTEGYVGKALKDAAIIIMITGAGGIFGKVLQNSGIDTVITSLLGDVKLGIILPFIIAAALKSAQGSSTVAMITTASLIAPMLGGLGIESASMIALTVVAIGAGSTVVSHANDSFFWVVTQMSGMDVSTGYRLHTAASAILGCSAIVIVIILSLLV